MASVLSNLGEGALLAWVSLPLLARLARPRVYADASTLHRAQLTVLVAAVCMLSVAWLPTWMPAWLTPRAPYYMFELRAVVAPMSESLPFERGVFSAALSPLAVLGAIFVLAVTLVAVRTAAGARALAGLIARATPAPDPLVQLLHVRAGARGMTAPQLLLSQESSIPFASGLFRPVIVLPYELVETLEQSALEFVLDHELEHVRRADTRMAACFALLKIALGGHPTAVAVAREALLAREIAFDARVSQLDARGYASVLVEIAAHAHFGEKPATTAIDDTALARRIALLSDSVVTVPLSNLPIWSAAGCVALAAAFAHTFITWAPPITTGRAHGFHVARAGFAGPALLGQHMFVHAPGSPAPFPPPPLAFAPPPPPLPLLLEDSAAVRACYAQAARTNPDLTVPVMVAVSVSAKGEISSSVTVPGAAGLAACLQQVVDKLPRAAFDAPAGANFVMHFELSPAVLSAPSRVSH